MSKKSIYSYHIFSFPFQWQLEGKSFSERINLSKISPGRNSLWKNLPQPETDIYKKELYNEKNYFYRFVHAALYDDGSEKILIKHYERDECYLGEVSYSIKFRDGNTDREFMLTTKSISLNLYQTGVGIMSFYLENYDNRSLDDVKKINQYGRRIYPPYLDVNKGISGTKDGELADELRIDGLYGNHSDFQENFEQYSEDDSWKPARFISNLLGDFTNETQWEIAPVLDDRMFVTCWVGNNRFSKTVKEGNNNYKSDSTWYTLIFVDGGSPSCENDTMMAELLKNHTLPRWQKKGALFGVSRYSFICLTDEEEFGSNVILTHVRTIYYRMAELCLVQRASILKFSSEVTQVSKLPKGDMSKIVNEVNELYKEYIRFVNKIYFREVTTQDQGIETYKKIQEVMEIKDHVKDLDDEIEELHQYASMLEEKSRSRNLSILTIAATVIVLPSFLVGYFGISFFSPSDKQEFMPMLVLNGTALLMGLLVFVLIKVPHKATRIAVSILLALTVLFTLFGLPKLFYLF